MTPSRIPKKPRRAASETDAVKSARLVGIIDGPVEIAQVANGFVVRPTPHLFSMRDSTTHLAGGPLDVFVFGTFGSLSRWLGRHFSYRADGKIAQDARSR